MSGWWESLSVDSLRSIHTLAQLAVLTCTLGVFVFGYLVFKSSGRLTELASQAEVQLREDLTQTRDELQQSERKRQPRELTIDQKTVVLSSLRGSEPRKVNVESIVGDLEGENYANEFEVVFSQAGWQVTRARATGNHGIQPGVRLIAPGTPSGQLVADASDARGHRLPTRESRS